MLKTCVKGYVSARAGVHKLMIKVSRRWITRKCKFLRKKLYRFSTAYIIVGERDFIFIKNSTL